MLCNVGLRDDSDELSVLFHDRQTTNLMLRHQAQRLVDILVGIYRHELARCDVGHPRLLRRLAFGDEPDRDVTVSDGADEMVGFHDRNEPDILVPHHSRGVDG
jgi:hypothetical protein